MIVMDLQRDSLDAALSLLGAILRDRGVPYELLAVGGSSMLLLGLIDRPTADLDVIASLEDGTFSKLNEMPAQLTAAVSDVASTLGLSEGWLNNGPASLMDHGLPSGWQTRLVQQTFDGLTLHLLSRSDLICLKLYAAVDRGPSDKHFEDLKRLEPTTAELRFAASRTVTHDPSEGFRIMQTECLGALGVALSDDDRS
jgi:hypothetical protein